MGMTSSLESVGWGGGGGAWERNTDDEAMTYVCAFVEVVVVQVNFFVLTGQSKNCYFPSANLDIACPHQISTRMPPEVQSLPLHLSICNKKPGMNIQVGYNK